MPPQYTEDTAKQYKDFLDQWNWQLHLTLTFRRECHIHAAMKKARTYLNVIKKENPKMRFAAAILATTGTGRNHVHALILSDDKYPITFDKLSIYQLEKHWKNIGTIEITSNQEWTNDTITCYLTKKKNLNLHAPDSYDLSFFRPQLLRQFKRSQDIHIGGQ